MNIKKIYQKEDGKFNVVVKFLFIIAVIVALEVFDMFTPWLLIVIEFLLGVSALLMFVQVVTTFKKGEAYILIEEEGITKVTKWNTVEKALFTDTFVYYERNGEVKSITAKNSDNKPILWISNIYEIDLKVVKEEIIRRQQS